MRVFVTGATGTLGRPTVKKLVSAGHDVRALARSAANEPLLRQLGATPVAGDLFDRDVALKVLPEAFTSDPDRLARFEREAKVLASLNHPNIAVIHGFEEDAAGGTRALVFELVEGPTLADHIAQGPVPVDDALPIA